MNALIILCLSILVFVLSVFLLGTLFWYKLERKKTTFVNFWRNF
jgi:hypothetical protein